MPTIEVNTKEDLKREIKSVRKQNFGRYDLVEVEKKDPDYSMFVLPDKNFQIHCYKESPEFHLWQMNEEGDDVLSKKKIDSRQPEEVIYFLHYLELAEVSPEILKDFRIEE